MTGVIVVPSRTPHLSHLCLARLLLWVLPERLLVLVSPVHVPVSRPDAQVLSHDTIHSRTIVESTAVVAPASRSSYAAAHTARQALPSSLFATRTKPSKAAATYVDVRPEKRYYWRLELIIY